MVNLFFFFVFFGILGVFLMEIKVCMKKIVFVEYKNVIGIMKDVKRE